MEKTLTILDGHDCHISAEDGCQCQLFADNKHAEERKAYWLMGLVGVLILLSGLGN